MAAHKFLKNNGGLITEESAVAASLGSQDDGKLVALNASGVLDATIVNSKTTSAGAGDTGKLPALDATGKLSTTFMPTGIAADVAVIPASEDLDAGDLVNVYDDLGDAKCRKADATVSGKEAHGFVISTFLTGVDATVYFEGNNGQITGATPGPLFLSTAAGLSTSTAPTGSGNAVQRVGFATSATSMNFQAQTPIILE